MKKPWLFAVVILVAVVVIAVSQGSKSQESHTIKIGAVQPLTGGTASSYGEYGKRGMSLALGDLNSQVGKQKIELTVEDSQGQPKFGIDAINKLIADGNHFIIGDQISGVTLSLAPIAEQNKILLIAPGSASPKLTDAGDYTFRTKVSAAVESKEVADYLINKLSIKKVAFLYQNSDYGKGVFGAMKEDLSKGGVTISAEEHYETGATDIRTQLAKIKTSDAELVLLAGYAKEIGQILKQANDLGVSKKFFAHSGSIGPDIIKIAGPASESLLFLLEVSPDMNDAKTKSFFDRYETKYGEAPELFSLLAYDTLTLLGEEIRACDQDVTCVKNALYELKDYKGITGPISFDENGDVKRESFTLFTIKDGKFVELNK